MINFLKMKFLTVSNSASDLNFLQFFILIFNRKNNDENYNHNNDNISNYNDKDNNNHYDNNNNFNDDPNNNVLV